MDTKMTVAPADLFVLIDREFRRRKARDCPACTLQLPYRVERRDGPNWDMIAPRNCGRGCAAVFEDLVREFQDLYELQRSG
jgi:hypothetical protein